MNPEPKEKVLSRDSAIWIAEMVYSVSKNREIDHEYVEMLVDAAIRAEELSNTLNWK